MDKDNLYQTLFQAYVKAYPSKKRQDCQKCVIELWNSVKKSVNLESEVALQIKKYETLALKKKGALMTFWSKQPVPKKENYQASVSVSEKIDFKVEEDIPDKDIPQEKPAKKAKVQEELKQQLDVINSDLVGYYKRKSSGMLTEKQETELKETEAKKRKVEAELKKKISDQQRQKKYREEKKKKINEVCEAYPHIKEALKIREKRGRPRLEADQPELLKAIVDIAIHGSAAHENRQSDVYRSIKTLDELTAQLKLDGFSVSRSGVYLRLLPKKSSTIEGKRHVVTAPVKLISAQNDSHLKHIDGKFCMANIQWLEELSSFLGPLEVCFISQDDKARVPIGLTAANKQSPLIMHVEYKVSLPDHDWVVAARHKLIPSVYAGIDIQKDGLGRIEAVGYSGPTYVAIRSGKHTASTAYSHGLDFERLLELPEFDNITKFHNAVKPVVIFVVDGGPDENPRYRKTIQVGVHHFLKNNLDALFIAANAPGRSAFNRVERRMAPLSKELSGLILPHEQYGSHLDAQGNTINPELEERNFEYAGKCLGEIWSAVVLDNYPTIAEYISAEKSELNQDNLKEVDEVWFSAHIRTSQYLTQIVKCFDVMCCKKVRSSFFNIVPSRFLPTPIPVCQTVEGLKAPINRDDSGNYKFPSLFSAQILKADELLPRSVWSNYKIFPYDLYCPSVQSVLPTRVCQHCGLYFASNVMLRKHITVLHKIQKMCQPEVGKIRPLRIAARRQKEIMAVTAFKENVEFADWVDEDDIDITGLIILEDHRNVKMPVYSINEHISSPWEKEP